MERPIFTFFPFRFICFNVFILFIMAYYHIPYHNSDNFLGIFSKIHFSKELSKNNFVSLLLINSIVSEMNNDEIEKSS